MSNSKPDQPLQSPVFWFLAVIYLGPMAVIVIKALMGSPR
jgi:hypothetical protein